MTAEKTFDVGGLPRRTILKTAAWSIPVVAATAATPFAAASTGNDVLLFQVGADLEWAPSPDNLTWMQTSATRDLHLQATGAAPTPAGTQITLSFDNRYLDAPALTTSGIALAASAPVVSGNKTTVTFTLPVEIPVDGTSTVVEATWGRRDAVYIDQADGPVDMVVLVTPAATDPNLGNNTNVNSPLYITTYDASVTGTFSSFPYSTPSGTFSWQMIDSVSIEALTPGDIAPGGHLMVVAPVSAVSNIAVTSVTVDGTAAPGGVTLQSQSGTAFYFAVNDGIPAGSTMVITFGYDVTTNPLTEHPGSTYANFSGSWSGERDVSNNQANPPFVP